MNRVGLIRRMRFPVFALLGILLAMTPNRVQAEVGDRPNIIIIMADDMGFSDIGCYGGEINTPTLDGLARGGVRFTQFYNTARCCPTRASLLTGLYPHQAGVGHMMQDRGYDGYRGDLNRNCVTIAEVLRTAGYATYMAGKWHVTKNIAPEGPKDNWPLQRGVDRFYGTITGAGSFYDPSTLTRDNTMISPLADPEYQPEQYYYTDAISDNAARFIGEHCKDRDNAKKPFFMYVAYTAAHWPMHALAKDVVKYKGKYDAGYEAIRKTRYEKSKQLGLIRDQWAMAPQEGGAWEDVEYDDWEIRCMEVYAAMVDSMDQGIGRIVDELKRNDEIDNTLIFYLQDNGGCAEAYGRRPGKYATRPDEPPFEPMADDELQLSMQPKQTRDGYPIVTGPGAMPGPDGTYIGYGKAWANVSNTPFREYKHWVHEGGISTPLIAHWPVGIERRNALEHQPGHLVDLMATCVDVAGASYPTERDGASITPMEGRSLVPAFENRKIEREALYWEHEGNRAVRVGKWKLVAKGARGAWELYDMEKDRTELHDLAEAQPARVEELAAVWQSYAERADVLPLNPQRPGSSTRGDFSKKKLFRLKQGDDLPRNKAPFVEGKALAISAKVETSANDGVILAQGGVADGYVVLLRDGKLAFATRHEGTLSVVAAEDDFPNGMTRIDVIMNKDGKVVLLVDRQQVAEGKVPGPMAHMPIDGLQVGHDINGAVGEYETPHVLDGKLSNVTVRVEK